MRKPLVSVLLSAAMLLSAGAARGWADTITFNNSSLHPDGQVTIGNTVTLTNGIIDAVARVLPVNGYAITGSCTSAGGGSFGCLNFTTGTFNGPVTTTGANDYSYLGGGIITVTGSIAALGLGPGTVLWSGTFDTASNVILQFDDVCQTNPTQCTGSVTGTLSSGTLNSVLAAALGVSPNTLGGNDQSLFFGFTGISMPAAGAFPTGTASGNTNQLEVVTPAAPVPESGSLILVGIGLVAGAKYLRRRRLA
ncbi:MAG TPA: PEP-CTERM sorting domain-containing protein [Vicinamibacterales bacterium]|nr:PEP-CTERM sorting domain-containing protein [Vicinamibacterales bacterium]